jgi:hypothetical protein
MTKHDFFFCYNPVVSAYLKYKGIDYICKAKHPASEKIFTLYYKDARLEKALEEYKRN